MSVYVNDKTNRITLRLNDEQFYFVRGNADQLGVSPSEFLRMVINSALCTAKAVASGTPVDLALKQQVTGSAFIGQERTVLGRENDKTDFHSGV